jgi:membrane associated rhomboid family serine protease
MPGRYRFSMPSNRDRTDPWFRMGSIDVTSSIIVSFLCVVSFFIYAANKSWLNPFIFISSDVRSGEIWRLFTYPFVNPPDIWVVISIAIFWYFGSRVEAQLGRVRYLWLLLLVTLLPGLVATLIDLPFAYYGIRSVELAIFVVFACENPKMPFFFGIQAWIIAVVIVGIELLQLIGDRQSELLIVYLAALVTAVWTARSFGMLNDFQWLPRIRLPKRSKTASSSSGATRSSGGRSVVVDGPWPSTPVYKAMPDQAEVDQILDKIALVGMDGLTSDEKRRLNEASKRLRKRGGG